MEGDTPPRSRYILVCDDIREEKSNKMILVGLYANRIIVESLPVLMPRLSIRICFDLSRPYRARFELAIRRPDGAAIGPFPVDVPPATDEFLESCINVNLVPFPLEIGGRYEVVATHGGGEALLGAFAVEAAHRPGEQLS